MLKVTDKKRSAGTMDSQVKSMVSQICRLWDDMANFERLFKVNLPEIGRLNQVNPVHAYVLEKRSEDVVEVWHVDMDWNRDRLLCEVSYYQETQVCYKTNEPCKFNCKGLCRESC